MSAQSFVPGPWIAEIDEDGRIIVSQPGSDGQVIMSWRYLSHEAEWVATASLIAAAPDLLVALTLLLKEVDESAIAGASDYGWPSAVAKSRAAILKATGGAP